MDPLLHRTNGLSSASFTKDTLLLKTIGRRTGNAAVIIIDCVWVHRIRDVLFALQSSYSSLRVVACNDGRKHVADMGDFDCVSTKRKDVSTCNPKPDGHRCVGDKGGQADLLAWDVVEVLWEVFG